MIWESYCGAWNTTFWHTIWVAASLYFKKIVLDADAAAALVTPPLSSMHSLAGPSIHGGQEFSDLVPGVATSQADQDSASPISSVRDAVDTRDMWQRPSMAGLEILGLDAVGEEASVRVDTEESKNQEDTVLFRDEGPLSPMQQESSSQDNFKSARDANLERKVSELCAVSSEELDLFSDRDGHAAQCTEARHAPQSLLDPDPLKRRCDVVCALNYCICLLHSVEDLNHYLRKSRAVFGAGGGIFVADLLGGKGAESSVKVTRRNHVTGVQFQWEQVGFDPVTRRLHAYLSLQHQASRRTIKNAFHYHWRLYTIPEVEYALFSAGFNEVKIWLRPMGANDLGDVSAKELEHTSADEESVSLGYVEYKPGMSMREYEDGWSAYVVGVVTRQHAGL